MILTVHATEKQYARPKTYLVYKDTMMSVIDVWSGGETMVVFRHSLTWTSKSPVSS